MIVTPVANLPHASRNWSCVIEFSLASVVLPGYPSVTVVAPDYRGQVRFEPDGPGSADRARRISFEVLADCF